MSEDPLHRGTLKAADLGVGRERAPPHPVPIAAAIEAGGALWRTGSCLYAAAAALAIAGFIVLIIETQVRRELEWVEWVRRHSPRAVVLLATPKPDGTPN
jgi:hypothetical protein